VSDLRAAAARRAHLEAQEALRAAEHARNKRDRLIRELRRDDPERWSYATLAKAIGCSRENIAQIVRGIRD
jgi:hypothetical protein